MAKMLTSKVPRLNDVARAAGLAPSTVSRFLNDKIVLPDETVARIYSAISELGYRPNPYARSLSRGRSDMLGLAVPDIQNPFFAKLASAIEISAEAAGFGVLLCSTLNRVGRELDYVERLRRNFVDGLLFATNHADDGSLARAINHARGNVVLVDEDIPGARVSKVFSDNFEGGHMAGRHLAERGHRTTAYIGGPGDLMSAIERGDGFRQAMREAGPDHCVVRAFFGDYSAERGRAAMRTILSEAPDVTAVFAGSDELTLGAISVLRENGLKIAQDISIVSFDDVAPLDLFDPPVTAIRQPVIEIAKHAFALIDGTVERPGEEPVCRRLATELIVRSSVGAPQSVRRRQPRKLAGGRAR